MKATFTDRDAVTPGLRRLIRKLDGAGRQAALEIMGMVVRDWAVESFTDTTKRVRPWKDKKDGTPATLQVTHHLRESYQRGVRATPRIVEIGSDAPYALRHQMGDQNPGMPSRPMLPVSPDGELLAEVREEIAAALGDYLGL